MIANLLIRLVIYGCILKQIIQIMLQDAPCDTLSMDDPMGNLERSSEFRGFSPSSPSAFF